MTHAEGFQVVRWHYNPSGSLDKAVCGEWFDNYQDAEAFVAGRLPRTRGFVTITVHRCGKPISLSGALFAAKGEA